MVPGCTNHSKKTTGVSYHRLPQDKRRKAVWLARIPRTNPCPAQYSFVCSDHFSPESFETDLAEQLCGHSNRRRLTLNAVPTIFPQSRLYVAPRKPRLTSERRSLKQAEQQVSYIIFWTGWKVWYMDNIYANKDTHAYVAIIFTYISCST